MGAEPSKPNVEVAKSKSAPSVEDLAREANRLEDEGNLDGAIAEYKEILLSSPDDVRAMNSIAGLEGVRGKFSEELRWTELALSVQPRYALAWVNRGNALGALGRPDEAEEAFVRALEIEPQLPEAHNGRGVLAERRRDFELAAQHFRRSVVVDPKFEAGWFSLAAALANLGRFEEAILALDEVLALNPDADDAQSMLLDIYLSARTSKATGCEMVRTQFDPVVRCAAFELLVSQAKEPLPLVTLAKVLSAGGVVTTETSLALKGEHHGALRLEKRRENRPVQVGWATIVNLHSLQRNVTCYLREPLSGDVAICERGLEHFMKDPGSK